MARRLVGGASPLRHKPPAAEQALAPLRSGHVAALRRPEAVSPSRVVRAAVPDAQRRGCVQLPAVREVAATVRRRVAHRSEPAALRGSDATAVHLG